MAKKTITLSINIRESAMDFLEVKGYALIRSIVEDHLAEEVNKLSVEEGFDLVNSVTASELKKILDQMRTLRPEKTTEKPDETIS